MTFSTAYQILPCNSDEFGHSSRYSGNALVAAVNCSDDSSPQDL